MAADGDAEIEATITRAKTLVGGRVWEGFVPDRDAALTHDANGAVVPHIILDFGASVRSAKDRHLSGPDLDQPHVLPLNAACIAGDMATARAVSKALFNLLVDWAPSATSDPWEAQGGYGSANPATANTPSRAIRGGFFSTTVNTSPA